MVSAMRVLIADDDPVVRDVVRRYLERDGLAVTEVGTGAQASVALAEEQIDLAILDIMMPAPDGVALCRTLRAGPRHDLPIILLTALGDEDDRVLGLEAGADDYVTKPFSPRELSLRVASVLRRAQRPAPSTDETLTDGAVALRTGARTVHVGHEPLDLTAREFDLLAFFLAHPQRVYSRPELLDQVWGWSIGDHSTVTVHVKRLRAKLGDHHRIETVWARGYAWGRTSTDEEAR